MVKSSCQRFAGKRRLPDRWRPDGYVARYTDSDEALGYPSLPAAACLAQSPAELMNDRAVRAAMEAAKRNEPATLDLQARICEIPAPPFQEEVRGQEFKRLFEQLGLHDVRIDKAGNVIGVRPGKAAHPNLVFGAHLDTVFPEGTNVKVTRDGRRHEGAGHRRRLPRPGGHAGGDPRARMTATWRLPARSRSSPTSARKGWAICAA